MQTISQNLFSKESALNFVSTFAAGLIPSRFTYISGKECALIGTVAGGMTSLSNAYLGEDTSTLKRALFSAAALALTYFSFAKLAPTLNRHLMVQLYPASILQVLAFNVLGHVVAFVVTKVYLTTPWNMSDEAIKTLHEKYVKDPELFKKHSNVEQQLLLHRFQMLELDIDKLEDEVPSKEEIEALTDDQIRTLHKYQACLSEDSANDALILRYFNLNLGPFAEIVLDIPTLSFPEIKTVADVENIGEEQVKWYAIYFEMHADKVEKLPKDVSKALLDKSVLTTLWHKSDAQIRVLHAKYQEDSSLCDTLSGAEELLLYHRFDNLELDTLSMDEEPEAEEIRALSEDQIRILHQHGAYVQDDSDNEVLLLRYFDLNLPPFENIEDSIPTLTLTIPKAVAELDSIKTEQFKWYAIYFEKNDTEFEALPRDVQWALFVKKGSKHYELSEKDVQSSSKPEIEAWAKHANDNPGWWVSLDSDLQEALVKRARAESLTTPAVHPTTPEEVQRLDEELVRAYNKSLPFFLEGGVNKALNLRFYELKLPFPNGETVVSLEKKKALPLEIDIALPSTVEAVGNLDDNQLSWVYAACERKDSGFSSLSFEVQAALNARFWDTFEGWHYLFSLDKISAKNIQEASETTLKILCRDFLDQLHRWISVSKDVFEAFQVKLREKKYNILETFKSIKTDELSKPAATRFHTYFTGDGKDIWNQLGKAKQGAFNLAFKKHSLSELTS